MNQPKVVPHSLFTAFDIDLFKSGKHYKLFEKMGAHPITLNTVEGVYFSVWAPTAKQVSVVGDFNYWNDQEHKLLVRWDESGIWEGFIPHVKKGVRYKFKITSHNDDIVTEKADPYGLFCETPPQTASIVWDTQYKWQDASWMNSRATVNALDKPFSVYEVHLESWRKNTIENRSLTYVEMATELVDYLVQMNFTHVEFMPVMEYPYSPSWGYQITGYFAPTSRFGNPQDFMYLIDKLHQNGIGVILDWVPSHFPSDSHGLGFFDGSNLYEHPNLQKGYHPDWKSLIFNYERNEVRSFLISNAVFWLEKYHIDALRVDAVASMIYLDYSRDDGEWQPNCFGGNENLEAISFLKEMNETVYGMFDGIQTIAEESTAFSGVSKPVYLGGLGFGMKWMMGWMHDTLEYFKKDSVYRTHHHNEITFSLAYAFTENFMLPLSHDEVVYGKASLFGRMPGDEWQRFANLRTLFGYMFTHPGSKLLFMGGEIAQSGEWNFLHSVEWHLLQYNFHQGIQKTVAALNKLYKTEKALHEKQFSHDGFEWISYDDHQNSIMSYIRKGYLPEDDLIIVCNFTPVTRDQYKIGVHKNGKLTEIFNTDAIDFGGSGIQNKKSLKIKNESWNGKQFSTEIVVPPLSVTVFKILS